MATIRAIAEAGAGPTLLDFSNYPTRAQIAGLVVDAVLDQDAIAQQAMTDNELLIWMGL